MWWSSWASVKLPSSKNGSVAVAVGGCAVDSQGSAGYASNISARAHQISVQAEFQGALYDQRKGSDTVLEPWRK